LLPDELEPVPVELLEPELDAELPCDAVPPLSNAVGIAGGGSWPAICGAAGGVSPLDVVPVPDAAAVF
jgi:hypothetical protein